MNTNLIKCVQEVVDRVGLDVFAREAGRSEKTIRRFLRGGNVSRTTENNIFFTYKNLSQEKTRP